MLIQSESFLKRKLAPMSLHLIGGERPKHPYGNVAIANEFGILTRMSDFTLDLLCKP